MFWNIGDSNVDFVYGYIIAFIFQFVQLSIRFLGRLYKLFKFIRAQ